MARHALTDTPTRGVAEYRWVYYDGTPPDYRTLVVGPYDNAGIAKRRLIEEIERSVRNINDTSPNTYYSGYTEIIDIRLERVTGWEVIETGITLD